MSGHGKHKNLQLVQWLRNPWVRCDNVARGPIPEWQAALMFEAANVIEQIETTRTPDPAQIRADALRAAGQEYILEHVMETDWHRQGRHSAIRGMMVRMGLYAELEAAIDEAIAESATPLSPTAVDNSPAPDAGGNGSVKSDWRSNSTKTEDGYNG